MSGDIWTSDSIGAHHARRRAVNGFRNFGDPCRGQLVPPARQARRQRRRQAAEVEQTAADRAAEVPRCPRQIYGVQPGDSTTFDVDRIANHENLAAVLRYLESTGGQSPGTDGMTFDMSPSEYYRLLRNLSDALRNRRYCPASTRRVHIPKASGGYRTLEIPTLIDRVVGAALAHAIRVLLMDRLPRFYSNGASVHAILARMVVMAEDHGWYWIGVDDIRDFYPSIPRSLAMDCCMREADRWGVPGLTLVQQGIPWLMRQLIYGNGGESRAIGLTQGSTFSPLAAAITLSEVLDLPIDRQVEDRMVLHRYADNIHVQGPDRSEVVSVMENIRGILQQHRMRLKEGGTVTRDVRQPSAKTILGVQTVWRDATLSFVIPDAAWKKLEGKLSESLTGNGSGKAQSTVRGFITAYRPTFTLEKRAVDRIQSMMRKQGIYWIPESSIRQWIAEAKAMWQRELARVRNPQETQSVEQGNEINGNRETGTSDDTAPWDTDR